MQIYADDTTIYADVMLKQQAACKLAAVMPVSHSGVLSSLKHKEQKTCFLQYINR